MTHVLVLSGEMSKNEQLKMSGYGKLYTLVICLDQLLGSKNHNNFDLRNTTTKEIAVLAVSIYLHGKRVHHVILLKIQHLDQLLGSKNHNKFDLRNTYTKEIAVLVISIFLHGKRLHHVTLLKIRRKTSSMIGYGRFYSNCVCLNHTRSGCKEKCVWITPKGILQPETL